MMKNFKNRYAAVLLTGLAVLFTLSSCQKKYDPKSYAPGKPAPTFGGYGSSKEIEPDSLVDYWDFNGTFTDSISKLPGTATGAGFSNGISGQAYNGALNQYAICQSSPAIAQLKHFTVSAWVNTGPPTTGVLDYFTLVNTTQFWGNIEMFFDNGSTNTAANYRVHINSNGLDYTFSPATGPANCFGAWVNLTFKYQESGLCTLYLNGKPSVTDSAYHNGKALKGPAAFTTVGNVVFGCTQFMTTPSQTSDATSQPWASYIVGKIDQVRVYNEDLSDAEVSALYNLESLGR